MKKLLFLFILALLPLVASAKAVEINGIYYNLVDDTKQAEVTYNPNKYSGEVVIPAKVTYNQVEYAVKSIGDGAFSDCSGLTSVTIQGSVTSIGEFAFLHCSSLTSVTIPNSVTSIGYEAFCGCSGLTSILIPNSVTSIGNLAFDGCSALTSITIPNSVTSIGECVFYGCSSLTSVTIPNSVTNIGVRAFAYCKKLTSITIPNSVTNIGEEAFGSCSGLTSITIPNSVTSIGIFAFSDCSSLTSVMIPNSVTSIGKGVFRFSKLISVTIPKSVTSIGDIAFQGCSSLTSVTIPEEVTSIGDGAFQYCKALTSITIGGGIQSIGSKAFSSCYNVKDVYCSADNVPTTSSDVFDRSSPGNITLHVPRASIDKYKASAPWSSFKSIVSIEAIYTLTYKVDGETYKTYEYAEGESITPEAEPTKEGYTFSGWSDIPQTMPDHDVTVTGTFTFTGTANGVEINGIYYNLKGDTKQAEVTQNPNNYSGKIDIPATVTYNNVEFSVTNIGKSAFQGCSGLTSITIPNSVTSIGKTAFLSCERLTSVTIGNSVTSIGDNAFDYCRSLTSITIPNSVTSIGNGTFNSCGLTSVTFSNNMTSIGNGAFRYCRDLTSITIPNSVTSIGYDAFADCSSLISVSIGDGIQVIGSKAFSSCQKITDVYCSATNVPNTESDAFDGSNPESITLHVPVSAINNYKTTAPWSSFKKVIGIGASYKLTYKVDGQVYKTYELAVGEDITPEAEPTKEGYTFSGWSDIPQTMPDHDVTVTGTFTANKYKLSYVVDGETYKTYDVEYGASITPEAAPTKEGHTFSGWSDIPQTMPAHDVTVTGTFSVSKYKLIYKVDGEVYKTYELKYGSTITPEAEPTKEGYTFSGWSDIPETMPAHDVTVTGTFSVNKYRLTYMVDDKEYKSYEVEFGSSITPEAEPTKKGHTFSGWSDIPQTMPARDVTVTGTFTVNKYKLTYMVDGEVYKSYDIRYGSTITPEAEPTKNGYKFSGWSDIPEEMPDYDVTVYGYFEKVYDVADVVSLVNIIMNLTTASSEDISAYDMNHDNDLDIGDMILVIKEILRSQQTRVRGQEQGALTRAADPYVDLAQFTAAQFTVSVPAGCAVEDIRMTGSNRYTHALVWEQIEAGLYAVVFYSDSNLKLSLENGNILEVVLSDKRCTEIATGNVVLATPEGERVWLNSLPAYAVTTGIANVRNTEAFDVYDLSGRKVRSQSHSLEGISSGVYIINGKKTVIK